MRSVSTVRTTSTNCGNRPRYWGGGSCATDHCGLGRFCHQLTLHLQFACGQMRLVLEVGGNGLSGVTAVNDGYWHHVAVVYDPNATNNYKLYVDGALDAQGNLTVATNTSSGTYIQIGKRVDGSNPFTGRLMRCAFGIRPEPPPKSPPTTTRNSAALPSPLWPTTARPTRASLQRETTVPSSRLKRRGRQPTRDPLQLWLNGKFIQLGGRRSAGGRQRHNHQRKCLYFFHGPPWKYVHQQRNVYLRLPHEQWMRFYHSPAIDD